MRKLLIVSGGTKGIGRAIALRFAREGFGIITCARNNKDLESISNEIKALPNGLCYTLACDLSLKSEADRFIKFINSIEGQVEVLVNNTGVFVPGQIHKEEEGVLEKMINTNLYSAYHLTRGILQTLIPKKRGHIFNICSTASITPYTNGGSYCISKYALYGMTKVLREEMKEHKIKVTAVLPGATLTASWEGANLPPELFMKAEDVADMIFATYNLSETAVVEDLLLRPLPGDIG